MFHFKARTINKARFCTYAFIYGLIYLIRTLIYHHVPYTITIYECACVSIWTFAHIVKKKRLFFPDTAHAKDLRKLFMWGSTAVWSKAGSGWVERNFSPGDKWCGGYKSCKVVIQRVSIGRQVLKDLLGMTLFLRCILLWSGDMIRKWPPKHNTD